MAEERKDGIKRRSFIMMRSLFSGVAGLKVHQSKMDVIGNNIANVNTVGYKTQNVTFTDVFYQTVQAASGPNAETGKGGTNAKQIGIGSALGTISTNVAKQGGMQATDNSFDVMINGEEFMIVSDGTTNFFTKAGNLNIDEAGNLVNGSGLTVMGWQVNDEGEVKKDRVSALRVMSGDKLSAAPSKTVNASLAGNINQKDDAFTSTSAIDRYVSYTVDFYDSQGYMYKATYHVKQVQETDGGSYYSLYLYDVIDQNGDVVSMAEKITTTDPPTYKYLNDGSQINIRFNNTTDTMKVTDTEGTKLKIAPGEILAISTGTNVPTKVKDGDSGFVANFTETIANLYEYIKNGVNEDGEAVTDESIPSALTGHQIVIDYSQLTNYGSKTSLKASRGDLDGLGKGKAAGKLNSIAISDDGKVVGNYSNGDILTLGQIAVTSFANAAGLEKVGDNLFQATMNSGSFDGIGEDITVNGDSFTTGVLEMSNVDLAYEFTEMITTQRGFQANSRIITVSDTMLEELINLKR